MKLHKTALVLALVALLLGAVACEETPAEGENNGTNNGANNGGNNGGGPAVSPGSPMGSFRVDSDTLSVTVPSGATSVALVIDGAGSNLILAQKITSPSGVAVMDWENDVLTNRTDATDGLYTLLIPNNPEVQLEAGVWTVQFLTDGNGFNATVEAVYNTRGPGSTIDFNLFFVGVEGLDAATAKAPGQFQDILGNVKAVYAAKGITLNFPEDAYIDISGADAEKYGKVDSFEEHAELFTLSGGHPEGRINYFFVGDISGSGGFELLGLSPGVPPGPVGMNGTERSGVSVNMADFGNDNALIEIIMAHELGHHLGLFHTTERNGTALDDNGIQGKDSLTDTPNCPDSADANGNKVLSSTECAAADGGNLMFWSPANDSRDVTNGQASVWKVNPVTK